MFIYPIFVRGESGSGTEGKGFAGKEIGDRMPLVRHGQFDFLLGISGIADDDHGLFLIGVLDIMHFGIERTGELFSSAQMSGLAIRLEEFGHGSAGCIRRLEIHDVVVEEIDRGEIA